MRLRIYLQFIVLAIVAAALFGALHDHISYSVSPEYYTRFKFLQFHLLDPAIPERLRAAGVGVLASWWMGIPLGVLTGAAGFLHRDPRQMRRALLWSLPFVVAVTLAFALGGLAFGVMRTVPVDLASYRGLYIPAGVEDPAAFLRVGYMHNFAYLGGAAAVPAAWIFHLAYRRFCR